LASPLTLCLTAAGTPTAVGYDAMYISRKFKFDYLFFENHDKLNIKKICILLLAF
jgi:hypothetical protein